MIKRNNQLPILSETGSGSLIRLYSKQYPRESALPVGKRYMSAGCTPRFQALPGTKRSTERTRASRCELEGSKKPSGLPETYEGRRNNPASWISPSNLTSSSCPNNSKG